MTDAELSVLKSALTEAKLSDAEIMVDAGQFSALLASGGVPGTSTEDLRTLSLCGITFVTRITGTFLNAHIPDDGQPELTVSWKNDNGGRCGYRAELKGMHCLLSQSLQLTGGQIITTGETVVIVSGFCRSLETLSGKPMDITPRMCHFDTKFVATEAPA